MEKLRQICLFRSRRTFDFKDRFEANYGRHSTTCCDDPSTSDCSIYIHCGTIWLSRKNRFDLLLTGSKIKSQLIEFCKAVVKFTIKKCNFIYYVSEHSSHTWCTRCRRIFSHYKNRPSFLFILIDFIIRHQSNKVGIIRRKQGGAGCPD